MREGLRMQHCMGAVVMLILLASASFAQSGLPATGSCVHTETFMGTSLNTRIDWSGDTATITTTSNDALPGQIVGLRQHDEHFKLSILYEDPITGPAEMTIFGMSDDGETRHRRAVIGYDILDDGTRVVSHVRGFEDITCSVLN